MPINTLLLSALIGVHRRPFVSSASEFLRHAHDFFHRGHAVLNLAPAVFAQIAHAVLARGAREYAGIGVVHDQLADLVGDIHHLEDPHARAVAAPIAFWAAGAAEGQNAFAFVALRL